MLATWTRTSVPASDFASVVRKMRCSARTGVYSWPWTPAVSASVGPGRAPWMMLIGMVVPSSLAPPEIVSVPDTVVPGGADRAPIVKGCWARAGALSSTPATASMPVSVDRCIDTSSSLSAEDSSAQFALRYRWPL